MASKYQLFWSEEALGNLESILDYLQNRWTEREVKHFKELLKRQLDLIIKHPFLFPVSKHHQWLRKAVLSKQTIIFYEIKDDRINLVYLFNTSQDTQKIK